MMLIHELSAVSHKLLLFLKDSPMKPEEKIAALKSSANNSLPSIEISDDRNGG